MTTEHPELLQLLERYRLLGHPGWHRPHFRGVEIPLPPPDALDLADELEALGIPIMGLDGWEYRNGDPEYVIEDTGVDYYVGDEVMEAPDAVRRSVALVKQYIQAQLPDYIRLVSFTLDVPLEWQVPPDILKDWPTKREHSDLSGSSEDL